MECLTLLERINVIEFKRAYRTVSDVDIVTTLSRLRFYRWLYRTHRINDD